jgi:hypothetical protein
VAIDTMAFPFLFDDQLDSPLGPTSRVTANICTMMIAMMHEWHRPARTDPPAAPA